MNPRHSRRELLGGSAASFLLVASAAGEAKAAELDGELIRLCGEYVARAVADHNRYLTETTEERQARWAVSSPWTPRRDRDSSWHLAVRISRIPARTPEGVRAKAEVVREWLRSCGAAVSHPPHINSDAETAAAWSLVADLLGPDTLG